MPSSFTRRQDGIGNTIFAEYVNELQIAIEQFTAGVYNVLEYGAVGDGTTDDTAAVNAARAAASASGGTLLFPGGKTYAVDQVAGWSDGVVIAHGATLLHNGDSKPLVTVGNALGQAALQRFRWFGGTLKAKQSATNPTTACLYLSNAWKCLIEGVHIEGGTLDQSGAGSRYAAYGIHLEGRQGRGVYQNVFIQPSIRGCATAALFIDGWDVGVSESSGNFTGINSFTGPTISQNALGIWIVGTNFDQFFGGHSENNTGVGIKHGAFVRDVEYRGFHMETNNGGTSNPQFEIDTSDPASQRRNTFIGSVDAVPPDAELRYWKLWSGTGDWYFGLTPEFRLSARFQRALAAQIAWDTRVDGETNPRVRLVADGTLQYRDPSSDVGTYFDAFKAAALDQIITGASTVFRPRGGIRVGEGTTIKKAQRVVVALNFGSIPAASQAEMTATVSGAALGDTVIANPRPGIEAGLLWNVYVSAADTVTVRLTNGTTNPIDPADRTWDILWMDTT